MPKTETRKPTAEQQAIIDAARRMFTEGHRVLIIEAGAGTGKTTTLRMLVDALTGRGQYTAFNSKLVADSSAKFQGTDCACNTTHSLAFRAEGKRFGHRLGGQRVRAYQIAAMLHLDDFPVTVGTGKE